MKHIFQGFLNKIQGFRPRNTAVLQKTNNRSSIFSVTSSLGTINLFSLAIPLLLETVANRLIGFLNSAVLSGYSENSVAAVGSANSVINLFPVIFSVISTGATVVISNLIGAEKLKRAYSTNFTQIVLCVCLGLSCSAVMLGFSGPIMSLMNLEDAILSEALTYYKIRVLALVVMAVSSGLSSILRCFGFSKATVITNLTTVAISLLLNVFVIKFPHISPITGVAGVAASTVVSQIIGLLLNIYFIKKQAIKFLIPKSFESFWYSVKKIVGIGFPAGISGSTFTLSQVITTSFIALIGTYALSAKVYYDNILCYAYLFSISFGSANSLLVGRLVGAGDFEHAKQLNKALVKLTVTVNLIISLLIVSLYKPLVMIFTDNPKIIEIALWVFLIDIIAEVSRAVSQVYEYALRGAGDMKFMLIVVMTSCWTISVGLSYFLSITLNFGIIGCYIAIALDELIRAIASIYRWRTNKWAKRVC